MGWHEARLSLQARVLTLSATGACGEHMPVMTELALLYTQ
jgi:hypothetical protein